MCLFTVTKVCKKTTHEELGYKIFRVGRNRNKVTGLFKNRTTELQYDKWLNERDYRDVNRQRIEELISRNYESGYLFGDDGKRYQYGFHVYANKQDALRLKYRIRFSCVRQVVISGVVAEGIQDWSDIGCTYVCKKMKILSQQKRKKGK